MMSMIKIKVTGSFNKTKTFLQTAKDGRHIKANLVKYAEEGLARLKESTPVDSGYTASCWSYNIVENGKTYSVVYTNSNVVDGQSIAILLQYGHASRSGAWVEGIDYINPALKPVFDKIANTAWEEMNK